MNLKAYSPARILGALRRRGLAYLKKNQYRPGRNPIQPNTVLFDSFNGKIIGDNPLAIFTELQKNYPNLKFFWTTSAKTVAPKGSTGVKFESKAWFELLATSQYIVANSALPWYFRKQPGQTYLQTWHGTPLKKLVLDLPPGELTQSYLDLMKREASSWDYLISPNAFCSEILPKAFGYSGRVLETGYPRNDRLTNIDPEERSQIRKRLNVTDDETILVLYAPTWRDYQRTISGSWELVSYLAPELHFPKNIQVMFRGHTNTATSKSQKVAGNSLDVTNYPDITDLYIAADVLVTDYSSVMFDFSVTGKPMLFLTPDIKRYRAERGFYFDLQSSAPGPILNSAEEALETLGKLPEISRKFQKPYKTWQQKFNLLEDGAASERVIQAVWGPSE